MKKFLIGLVRFYQKYLSGMKGYSTCIYFPTCSQYAIEALEKYGASKGVFWQYGGSFAVIHLQKEDTTRFHRMMEREVVKRMTINGG